MNTKELMDTIRDGLVEYQNISVTDEMIERKINACYRRIFNHYARTNPDMYAVPVELDITANDPDYTIPKNLWSKRIHKVMLPYPGSNVRGYYPVEVVSYKEMYKYNIPYIKAQISTVCTVTNNTITFYPTPAASLTALLFLTPRLIPLKKVIGVILDYDDATKTLTVQGNNTDGTVEASAVTTLSDSYSNVITITDYYTGLVKHILAVTSVSGNTLVIGAPVDRTTIYDQTVEDATAAAITDISPDDCITLGYSSGVSIFGEAFDEYLENYAVLKIGSNYDEVNPKIDKMFEDIKEAIKSDTVGRPALQTITRMRYGVSSAAGFRRVR